MAKSVNADINSRIRAIYENVFNSNATLMAKRTYISRTTILSIIGESQTTPGYDVIRKLAEMSTPEININWLITGEGGMLKTLSPVDINVTEKSYNEKSFNNSDEIIKELTATIRSQQEMIKKLTDKLLTL